MSESRLFCVAATERIRITDTRQYSRRRDLKRLCELDLLIPKGEKRGRTYVAAPALRDLRSDTLDRRRSDDPYALARERQTPLLF